jgi:Antirestriction protein
MSTTDTPRIYVASLADYNAGRLHGVWIDATQDAHDIKMCIFVMLSESAEPVAEEWAIHDHEGFGSLRIGEYESIERIAAVAEGIEEHGAAFVAYVDNFGFNDADLDAFEENYLGEFDNVEDYAREFLYEWGDLAALPESLRNYFDYAAFARDMELGGDIWTAPAYNNGVHIFRNV